MRPARADRCGFSLVEATVALTITMIAGAAVLGGLATSMRSTDSGLEATLAEHLAERLIDEIAGKRYHAVGAGAYQWPMSANSWETSGSGRERYDDIDDYHGFSASPPEGVWGEKIGTGDGAGGQRHENFRVAPGWMDNWREEIEVYYVDENDPSVRLPDGTTSGLRAVHVFIYIDEPDRDPRLVAERKRIFAYVPQP